MYETEQDMPGERTHAAGVGRRVMILRECLSMSPECAAAVMLTVQGFQDQAQDQRTSWRDTRLHHALYHESAL